MNLTFLFDHAPGEQGDGPCTDHLPFFILHESVSIFVEIQHIT